MSYWLCPRAAAQPLLGLTARAAAVRRMRGPSRETLRWLSCSVASSKTPACSRISHRNTIRPRCAPQPSTYLPRTSFDRRTFFSRRIAKKYEQLPANYRDDFGLDFRTQELSQEEVDRVFRRGSISADDANTLLRILHGRRVAGTLEDPAFAENTARFSDKQIDTALEYLRITVPVDEALNAGLRAEDELAQLEKEEEMREEGIEVTDDKTPEGTLAKALYKPDPVYGPSRFDKIRAENEAKSAALEAAREARKRAEEEAAGGAEALERAKAGPMALIKEDGGKIMNPKIAEYYMKAQEQGDVEPELVTFWQRILPSVTVVTLVVGFLAAVTTVYEEPADTYRMVSSLSTAQATVGALIGANLLVWLGWKVPPLWGLFNRYMIFVVGKVKPVTLLTANFSHQKFTHLVMNMVPLYFVGTALHEDLDRAQFLTLYTACGAAGYMCSLVVYTLRGWLSVSSLGASGCTLGVVTAYFWGHKGDGFRFFGIPEEGVHGIVFLAFVFATQLGYLGRAVRSKVDLASHLGGMAMGMLGMEVIQRSRGFPQRRQPQEDGVMREVEKERKVVNEAEGKEEDVRKHIDVFGWMMRRGGYGGGDGDEECDDPRWTGSKR